MIPIARSRSRTLHAALATLLLTACQHSMTASLGGSAAASPTTASTTTQPTGTANASAEPVSGPMGDTAELIGMTIEEANRRARDRGYTSTIDIIPLSEFQAGCKPETVCRVSPRLWELLPGRALTLYLNRKLTITNSD